MASIQKFTQKISIVRAYMLMPKLNTDNRVKGPSRFLYCVFLN